MKEIIRKYESTNIITGEKEYWEVADTIINNLDLTQKEIEDEVANDIAFYFSSKARSVSNEDGYQELTKQYLKEYNTKSDADSYSYVFLKR